MFDLSNCAPGEEIEVQVRAIAVGTNGERAEGEWSRVAVGRTAPQPPSPPLDVRLDSDNTLHWSPPANINGAPITEYILERTVIPSSARYCFRCQNVNVLSHCILCAASYIVMLFIFAIGFYL